MMVHTLEPPGGENTIKERDTLVVYGRTDALQKLGKCLEGNQINKEHQSTIRQQERVRNKELEESEK